MDLKQLASPLVEEAEQ
ncbi:793d5978-a77f-4855-ae36-13bfd3a98c88 [Thermothielavioides terrestris]|uniref:793d5978-a77f-4855-ae36-13bfd3a98c88 n=1 Tax=Thermothielavioides terrestris TaxID=2587410 RepID=A0A3S4D7Z1_9PEZI|nr:793d5978-a77f-4855-ae36-13bfd3a98c88 [Thermothielavioides terrestris]